MMLSEGTCRFPIPLSPSCIWIQPSEMCLDGSTAHRCRPASARLCGWPLSPPAAAGPWQQSIQAAPVQGCKLCFETPLSPDLFHTSMFPCAETGSGSTRSLLDPAKRLLHRSPVALGLSLSICKMGLERCSQDFYSLF